MTQEQERQIRVLVDAVKNADKANIEKPDTLITIKNELGEVLHSGLHNKVIVSGSAFTMMKHYNLDVPNRAPSYNNILQLENTLNEAQTEPGVRRDEVITLFCCGIGGCNGSRPNETLDVDYSKWISPDEIIPFRNITPPNDLSALERTKYFGRKIDTSGNILYYFKAFETQPELIQRYVDGTPIDSNVFTSTNILDIESFVHLRMKITVDDFREHFAKTIGVDQSRINSMSLISAYPTEIDGHIYYQNCQAITRLHFPTEYLNTLTKSLEIDYLTFY